MDADALREAITKEMMDYRRPRLLMSQMSYILRPVTTTCSSDSVSVERDGEKCQQVPQSTVSNTCSQSESPGCIDLTSTDVVNDVSLTDVKVKLKVAAISTDGNSVEMPSATTSQLTGLQLNDVAMLSAGRFTNGNIKSEICQDTSGNDSDRTVTAVVNDNRTDSTVIKDNHATDNRSVSNSLAVNTELPQAADAKARIKAALLNSGRRRQRLGE